LKEKKISDRSGQQKKSQGLIKENKISLERAILSRFE
jgi:hypothetical protein